MEASLIALTQGQARLLLLLMLVVWIFVFGLILFALGFLRGTAGVMKEYERGVVYLLGRLRPNVIGPGLFWRPPFISQVVRVDTRDQDLPLDPLELTLGMNVRAKLTVVGQIRVSGPLAAVNRSVDYLKVVADVVTNTFQSKLSNQPIDRLISGQQDLLAEIRSQLDPLLDTWGVQISVLAIRRVEWPDALERALAREASATYDLRGDQVRADGEAVLAPKYLEAAKTWLPNGTPQEQLAYAFELRRLATLEDMQGNGSVVVDRVDRSAELPPPAAG